MLTRRQLLYVGGAVLGSALAGGGVGSLLSRRLQPAPPPMAAKPAADAAPRPFVVALLSDTHVRAPGDAYFQLINGKLAAAAADLDPLQPDLWLCCGDEIDHGLAAEFASFRTEQARHAPAERWLVTTGNHEFYDTGATDSEELSRFLAAFGLQQAYTSHLVAGVHLVLLADEQYKTAPKGNNRDWAWLTPEQLTWFERVLGEHRDTPTLVFLHQPLQDTVADTTGAKPASGTGQTATLRQLIGRNPQIKLWFSGHTHVPLDRDDQQVVQGKTTFIALGSTAYLEQGGRDYDQSQSRVLEIHAEKLVVKARDHSTRQWLKQREVTVPLT